MSMLLGTICRENHETPSEQRPGPIREGEARNEFKICHQLFGGARRLNSAKY